MAETEIEPNSPDGSQDAPPVQPEGNAPSSSADAGGDDKLLSVVRDAVQPHDAAASQADNGTGTQPGSKDVPASAAAPDPDDRDNEFGDVPFRQHPRFRQLIRQRNAFKDDATRYRNVQNFLDANGLSGEEAFNGLRIMALMKVDPAQAWKELQPHVQRLIQQTGEVLPRDLADEVRAGKLPLERAKELSRARAAEMTRGQAGEFRQQLDRQNQARQLVASVQQAVADWERTERARDPDFESLYEDLKRESAYNFHSGRRAKTPQEALEFVKKDYAAVKARRVPTQQRRPINPVLGGQVAGNARPQPKSMLDVVKLAVAP
jgi:hypothetical protein